MRFEPDLRLWLPCAAIRANNLTMPSQEKKTVQRIAKIYSLRPEEIHALESHYLTVDSI